MREMSPVLNQLLK